MCTATPRRGDRSASVHPIPNDHAGEEREILQRLLDGGHVDHYETERLRKDGSRVPVALTISDPGQRRIDPRRLGDRARHQRATPQRQPGCPPAAADHRIGEDDCPRGGGERRPAGGAPALNAHAGAVGLLDEGDETIRVAGYSGYSENSLASWETFSVKAALPMSEVVRTGRAAWVVGKEELVSRYPALSGSEIQFRSRAVVPLRVHGRVFGAISLSFRDVRRFAPDERTFLEAIVQQAAYALDRARLHAAEQAHAGRRRLRSSRPCR